jgi:predicted nicotinamide N-methyase
VNDDARDALLRELFDSATSVTQLDFLSGMKLRLSTELLPVWTRAEELHGHHVPPPFWAFAWVGGQAVSRWVLDNPDFVRGKRVLDFAAGAGLQGIAAAMSGAAHVVAVEIDPIAVYAVGINAALNDVRIDVRQDDVVGRLDLDFDVILAGDICYERTQASRFELWLRALAATGRTVIVGDPGRTYFPRQGMECLATWRIATSREIEHDAERDASVWRVLAT